MAPLIEAETEYEQDKMIDKASDFLVEKMPLEKITEYNPQNVAKSIEAF
jgi:hypothetical protein